MLININILLFHGNRKLRHTFLDETESQVPQIRKSPIELLKGESEMATNSPIPRSMSPTTTSQPSLSKRPRQVEPVLPARQPFTGPPTSASIVQTAPSPLRSSLLWQTLLLQALPPRQLSDGEQEEEDDDWGGKRLVERFVPRKGSTQ